MARLFGAKGVTTNYEVSVRKPFDARSLVPSYEDLISKANWLKDGSTSQLVAYNGMIVAVANTSDTTKNGVYMLFDVASTSLKAPNVTTEANWHKLADFSDLTSIIKNIEDESASRAAADIILESKITEALQEAKAYADEHDANTIYNDTELRQRIEAIEQEYIKEINNFYTKEEIDSRVSAIEKAVDEESAAREAITAEIEAIKAIDIVMQDELDSYKDAVVVAIAAAKQETTENFENILHDYAKTTEINAELIKKIESGSIAHSSDTLAEGVTVDGTRLSIVIDAYTKSETRDYVAEVIRGMTGGDTAADVLRDLNAHIATYNEKIGQIDVRDSDQDAAIVAINTIANQTASDVAKIAAELSSINGTAATNSAEIESIKVAITELQSNDAETISEINKLTVATEVNTAKLLGINSTVNDAINAAIDALVIPKASAEVTVDNDGSLGIGKVSTDKLVQGVNTLVLDGGSAA